VLMVLVLPPLIIEPRTPIRQTPNGILREMDD
jgi:hypothetical protein